MKTTLILVLFAPLIAAAQSSDDAGRATLPGEPVDMVDLTQSPVIRPLPPPLVTGSNMPMVPSIAAVDATGERPGEDWTQPPPPINLLSNADSELTAVERRYIALAKDWIEAPRAIGAQGENGAIVFRFGVAMPAVVCAPLYVCDIALQPGETVNNVQIGDAVRWKVTPAVSGAGVHQRTHVIVKPIDIGLTTNLIVTTDRRAYNLKLVSRRDDWMPALSFSYPEDEQAQWAALNAQKAREEAATILPDTGQTLTKLDFGYRIKGDRPDWRPLRVYSDGRQTFIQFPASMHHGEAPALVAIGDDKKEQLVNYRVIGDRYVVDKVLSRAVLLSGVGRRQTKVELVREEDG